MTSPRAESDSLIAFPSSNLLPRAFVFSTRSLSPRSTIHILFVSLCFSVASKQVINMRIMQCDLLEDLLEFVEAVDLTRHPNLYSFFAWLKSFTWMATRLLILISPLGSVWIVRLQIEHLALCPRLHKQKQVLN